MQSIAAFEETGVIMFHKILCPTDFSEASYKGLQIAADLALQNNAELCVLYVESPLSDSALYSSNDAARCAKAVSNICAVIEHRIPIKVRSRPLFKCGEAEQEIQLVANQESADLIVLTTCGAGSSQPGGLGKVAGAILCAAPCPVLTINVQGIIQGTDQKVTSPPVGYTPNS